MTSDQTTPWCNAVSSANDKRGDFMMREPRDGSIQGPADQDAPAAGTIDHAALEEYKLCAARQQALLGRTWPMASVLLIFSLGGLALFGREEARTWPTLALVGIVGSLSIALLWLWRILDWRETWVEDLIYERMWELERRLGFLTNLAIHFVLLSDSDLARDTYWKDIGQQERSYIATFRTRRRLGIRMRWSFNIIALAGTFAWGALFAVRLAEFVS